MRVLVCGGRGYNDAAALFRVLDGVRKERGVRLIIHGGAAGADRCAGQWAETAAVPCLVFPAPWAIYGARAGPIRNSWMLEHGKPDLVVAFPGGKGTANMVRQARAAGVEVLEAE